MKDNRTLLLGLLAFGLVGTWVYHFYDKSQYSKQTPQILADSITVSEATRDTLESMYSAVNRIDTVTISNDSLSIALKGELGEKIREIRSLKNQVATILKKKQLNNADMKEARSLIRDLQQKIAAVQVQNDSLINEKGKLSQILDELGKEMAVMQLNMQRVTNENKEMARTLSEASTFVASELRLVAMNLRAEEKEEETNSVKKADKFVVSFVVQNYINDVPGAELVIAIKEPTGRIMIGEGWNAGTFDTRAEGRKEFTRKVRFEYTKGEQKRIIFSIDTEKFQKGIYRMLVYHNGVMIGETSWMLS